MCAPAGPGGAERGGVSGRSLGRRRRGTGPAGAERSPGGSPAPRGRAAQIRQLGSSGPVRTSDRSLAVQRDRPGHPLPTAGPGGQVRPASSSAAARWTRRVSALGSAGLPRAGCEGVGERGCSHDGRVAQVVKRAAAADSRGQRRVGGEGVQADDVADGGLGYAPAEQDVAANGCGPEVVEVCGRGELSTLDVHVGEQLVQVEPVGGAQAGGGRFASWQPLSKVAEVDADSRKQAIPTRTGEAGERSPRSGATLSLFTGHLRPPTPPAG